MVVGSVFTYSNNDVRIGVSEDGTVWIISDFFISVGKKASKKKKREEVTFESGRS